MSENSQGVETGTAIRRKSSSLSSKIPEEMRALVLSGVGFDCLQIRKVPTPRPGTQQLLARVDAAGICTSLIKLVEQGPDHNLIYGWDISRYPLILGDEGSVTLVAVGEGLRGSYNPGERYVIQPAVDYPPINFRERYPNAAKGVFKLGVGYTLQGHLAEYILISEEIIAADCLLPLPDAAIPYAHAAMSEPFSCVVSAQDHHLHLVQDTPLSPREVKKGLKTGGLTIVVGAGAMGRMHVDLALNYRPRAILVTDLIQARLEQVKTLYGKRAEELGVQLYIKNPATSDIEEFVVRLSNHQGADDVIVAVGSRKAIEIAQHLAGRGAVLNLFGGLKREDRFIQLDTSVVHYKETIVTGSSGGSPWDIAQTLELMVRGEIEPATHITQVGDLDHAVDLLQMVKSQEIDGKAVVYPHRRSDQILTVQSWSSDAECQHLKEV